MSPHKSFLAILMALFLFALPNSCFAEYGGSALELQDASAVIKQDNPLNRKTYEDMYQQTWQTLEQKYFFRQNMGDWSRWQHKYDGKLTSLSETEAAIKEMVGSLKDPYSFFLDGKDTSDKAADSKKTGVVTSEMIADEIGYIEVDNFNSRNTAKEIFAALQQLHSAKALIIDLRDNRGGYIDEAMHATSFFLEEGAFISMATQESATERKLVPLKIAKEYYSSVDSGKLTERHEAAIAKNIPIVILVDDDTASASEMLAGCLQEHKRAVLVGQQTFGKGIAQEFKNLSFDTSLRYTFADWTLPVSGKCVHKIGLTPDVILQSKESAKDAAVKYLRSKHAFKKPN